MWQPFLRAKPALECGSSSYRLPPLLCAAITQREGKAVAAATALQGASRRLRLRLARIGHKGPPHVVIMLTKNIKWGGIALPRRRLPVPQSGGSQGAAPCMIAAMRARFFVLTFVITAVLPGLSHAAQKGFDEIARDADAARTADRMQDAIHLYRQGVGLQPSWQDGW